MAFKKITKNNEDFGTFVEWETGISVEGVLLQIKTIKTKYGEADVATIHEVGAEGNTSFIIKPTMKYGKLTNEIIGQLIKVTPTGEKEMKSGNMAMQFEVEVDEDELP